MSEWYYARGGKQEGPVSFENLTGLARSGGLDAKDLVWTSTMKDWLPASQVDGIFQTTGGPPPPLADPNNPYAAPDSAWNEAARVTAAESGEEIVPGSEPINVGGCVKRGFELTTRNFGMILLVGIVYFAVSLGSDFILSLLDGLLWPVAVPEPPISAPESPEEIIAAMTAGWQTGSGPLTQIIGQIVAIFLSLGVTRVGLNIASGRDFSIGMLFGGGNKLLPAIGASLIFWAMVAVGLMLLIVPGIYLALRYGQYLTAMVDRNLGVMESFSYSSTITTGNRMNLFLLFLLSMAVALAGMLALCVGLIFAIPVVWLAWMVAYRWMQHGHRAAIDQPGTLTPMTTSR